MWAFHRANPHIYQEFEEIAMWMIKRGAKRVSGRMIIEYLRASHYIKTLSADGYKINNDFIAYYTRYFIHNHPQFEKYFEIRATVE